MALMQLAPSPGEEPTRATNNLKHFEPKHLIELIFYLGNDKYVIVPDWGSRIIPG